MPKRARAETLPGSGQDPSLASAGDFFMVVGSSAEQSLCPEVRQGGSRLINTPTTSALTRAAMAAPLLIPAPAQPPGRTRCCRWSSQLLSLLAALLLPIAVLWAPATAAADGAELFGNHCAGCHLHGGNIIRRGRTLRLPALQQRGLDSAEAIAAIAAAGIGQMSGYGPVLGEDGVQQVADWVWQQAQLGWPKG